MKEAANWQSLSGIYCTLGFFDAFGVRSLQAPPWHLPVEL